MHDLQRWFLNYTVRSQYLSSEYSSLTRLEMFGPVFQVLYLQKRPKHFQYRALQTFSCDLVGW